MRISLSPLFFSLTFFAAVWLPGLPGQDIRSTESFAGSSRVAHFIDPSAFDPRRVVPPAPAAGSLAALTDLETVLRVQAGRTSADIAWAKVVEKDNVFDAAEVLGPWFTKENLPLTAKLLRQVNEDARLVNDRAKDLNARPRPPLADPQVRPCVRLPATASYPSGHSMNAFVWAGVLSELFPEKRADLTAWAHRYAWGRIIGGVHFPSDDVAGRLLAAALLKGFLKSPVFQADLERARSEARPYLLKKAA